MKTCIALRGAAALLLALSLGLGCKQAPPSDSGPPPEQYERFAGLLRDRSGNPLSGKLSINTTSTTTQSDGAFELQVPRAEKYVITAQVTGHVVHSEVYAGPGRNNLSPQLVPAEVFTFDATQPLNQEDSRGTLLQLPAEALVDANGKPPSGPVTLSMHTYDLYTEQMVGDLTGLDANGKSVALRSFGAVSVEFSDAAGTSYNLAPGKKAKLALRVPEGTTFEGTVPLWWFDTQQGLWREEGSALIEDGVATGQVSHFTVWNVDMAFNDPACIQIRVDPAWFAREGYSFRNPLRVEARVTSPWLSFFTVTIEDPEQVHVLYNMASNSSTEFIIGGKPYALVSSGSSWGGGGGYPGYPYNECQGKLLLDGTVQSMGSIEGRLQRQHRATHEGVQIAATRGSDTFSAFTDANGVFLMAVPPGLYTVTASRLGYLSAQRTNVRVEARATLTLPEVTIVAGNVDDQDATGCITPVDTGLIISAIDGPLSWDDPRDLDGDRKIDFLDLALAAANGGQCGPVAW